MPSLVPVSQSTAVPRRFAPAPPLGCLGPVLACALAMAFAPLRAGEPGPLPAPGPPTLVCLAPPSGPSPDAGQRFGATVLRDLKLSGAFRLLDAKSVPGASDSSGPKVWHRAGASFLLRIAASSVTQGKLLIQGECINLETGAVVLRKAFRGETGAVNRMAHRLADFMVGKLTGTPGIADSSILFARATAPGIEEIFAVDRDGRNRRQLTAFGSLTSHPALSRDGRLAVVTYKGGPPQIWGERQAGGPFTLLFPKEGAPGMALGGLAWAPDGQRLCFVQDSPRGLSDIHVLDLRSGRVTRLTPEGHTNRAPCWNPAGTELAFVSDRDGSSQVYVMASDGSQVRRLTGDPTTKLCVAWSPRNDRIGFVASSAGQSSLFTLSPAGTGRQQVASALGPVQSLCWAPDGRWLLLGLEGRQGSSLRIASLDGKLQDLAADLDGSRFPQWAQNFERPRRSPFPGPALMGTPPL